VEKCRPLFSSAWKSRNPAGFPLSHSHGDGGPFPRVAAQIQNQAPSVNLWLDQKRRARQVGIVGASVVLGLMSILLAPRDSSPRVTPHSETTR
jgi:hypothetical protein